MRNLFIYLLLLIASSLMAQNQTVYANKIYVNGKLINKVSDDPTTISDEETATLPSSAAVQAAIDALPVGIDSIVLQSDTILTYYSLGVEIGRDTFGAGGVSGIDAYLMSGSGLDGDTLVINSDTLIFPLYGVGTISDDLIDEDSNGTYYRFDNGAGTVVDFGYYQKSVPNVGLVLYDVDGTPSGDTLQIIATDSTELCWELTQNDDIVATSPDIVSLSGGIYDVREGKVLLNNNGVLSSLAGEGDTILTWESRIAGQKLFRTPADNDNKKPRIQGEYIYFDGVNDRMVSNISDDVQGTPKTIAFIVSFTGGGEFESIVSGGDTGPGSQDVSSVVGAWQLGRGSAGNGTQDSLVFKYRDGSGDKDLGLLLWSDISDGTPHYCRLTYTGSSLILILDGEKVADKEMSQSLYFQFLRLFGNRSDGAFMEALMGEFFYSDTLSHTQNKVLDNYFVTKYEIDSEVAGNIKTPVSAYISPSNWIKVSDTEGVRYYNTVTEVEQDTMPYDPIGPCGEVTGFSFVVDDELFKPKRYTFTADGTNTIFPVLEQIDNNSQIAVYNGGLLAPESDYSISDKSIVFSTAPTSLNEVVVLIMSL